jgi:YegS/Rv2252/BmrU family lipid kinase
VAKGDKARTFRKHLDDIARQATLASTTRAGDAQKLAADAVTQGFDTIIAAGGDGTVNEVLNGICEANGLSACRLGVLPLGTINVFARELGIKPALSSAWRVITEARVQEIDLPLARHKTPDGKSATRYFAQLAGAGFDARAIELTDWSLKKRVGPLAYVAAGLKCMTAERVPITVQMGEERCEGELALIGNGRLYGGDYPVFHEAALDDGLLEVSVFPSVDWTTLARCGPNLLLGRKLPEGVARRFKARELSITAPARVGFQLDGEFAGCLPAHFAMADEKLRVLVPGGR